MNEGPRRDIRELQFSEVFVTMSLSDGKSQRAFDKAKVEPVVSNSTRLGRGQPVCATFMDSPFRQGHGTLLVKGTYTEKEDAEGSVKCRYKAYLNTGSHNRYGVVLVGFKPNKPSGSGLSFVLDRIRQDTKYACVHFITDIRGMLARGDLAFSRIKLADHKSKFGREQFAERLASEYEENLSRNVHTQNEFRLAQIKVVAKVIADEKHWYTVSLEKMALHNNAYDSKIFKMKYEQSDR